MSHDDARFAGQSQNATAAAEIVVTGRVQGVGYRDFCVRAAAPLGLVGYAMNLHDGGVRVVVEGKREAIEMLACELERGPRLARVEHVAISWIPPRGEFTGFGVRYSGRDA